MRRSVGPVCGSHRELSPNAVPREGAARSDWSALSDAVRDMGEKSGGNISFVIARGDNRGQTGLFWRREPRPDGGWKQRPGAQLSHTG